MTIDELARQLGADGRRIVNRAVAEGDLVVRPVDGRLEVDRDEVGEWAERYRYRPTGLRAGLGAVVLLVLLAACGGSGPAPTPSEAFAERTHALGVRFPPATTLQMGQQACELASIGGSELAASMVTTPWLNEPAKERQYGLVLRAAAEKLCPQLAGVIANAWSGMGHPDALPG